MSEQPVVPVLHTRESVTVPAHPECRITHEIMTDPVVAHDGYVYWPLCSEMSTSSAAIAVKYACRHSYYSVHCRKRSEYESTARDVVSMLHRFSCWWICYSTVEAAGRTGGRSGNGLHDLKMVMAHWRRGRSALWKTPRCKIRMFTHVIYLPPGAGSTAPQEKTSGEPDQLLKATIDKTRRCNSMRRSCHYRDEVLIWQLRRYESSANAQVEDPWLFFPVMLHDDSTIQQWKHCTSAKDTDVYSYDLSAIQHWKHCTSGNIWYVVPHTGSASGTNIALQERSGWWDW